MIFNEKDFERYADFFAQQESQELRPPSDFADQVATIAVEGERQQGDQLLWQDVDVLRLRPAELSIWAGINGHGKSLLLDMVMLWQMQNKRVVIASLEMLPRQTLWRMACQFAGCRPDPDFARSIVRSMNDRLWLYDQQDTVSMLRMLAMCLFCARQLRADHIVIDSLLKCGIAEDDYKTQKQFVDRLQWLAKSNNTHIHLVAHMRKRENENFRSGKLDIRGTSAITDLADNVLIVRRNKRKEQTQEKLQATGSVELSEQKYLEQCDAYLTVEKNRHGQREGTIGLFFDPLSMQYTRHNNGQRILPPWKLAPPKATDNSAF